MRPPVREGGRGARLVALRQMVGKVLVNRHTSPEAQKLLRCSYMPPGCGGEQEVSLCSG